MKRIIVTFLMTLTVLGFASIAFAENGSVLPDFGAYSMTTVRLHK